MTAEQSNHRKSSGKRLPNINDLMAQSFHLSGGRELLHRAAIQGFARLVSRGKFRITVLREVLDSFFEAATKTAPLRFDFGLLNAEFTSRTRSEFRQKQFFSYDEKIWRGTANHDVTTYTFDEEPEKFTYFINIKLPNDGYQYTPDYFRVDEEEDINLENDELDTDNVEVVLLMQRIFLLVSHYVGKEFGTIDIIRSHYDYNNDRLSFYCWNQDHDKCVTIKWENGFPSESPRSKERREVVDRRVRNLLSMWQTAVADPEKLEEMEREHKRRQDSENEKETRRREAYQRRLSRTQDSSATNVHK